MENYTMKRELNGRRRIYNFAEKNKKGEAIVVAITTAENSGGKNSLPILWQKAGYIDRVLDTYLCVDVNVTDKNGHQWIKYNPTFKPADDGKRYVINFDWTLEATTENEEKILAEIERLAFE